MTEIFGGPGIYVYHLGNAAPRVYVASKLVGVDESSVIESGEIQFDRSYEALIDERSLRSARFLRPQRRSRAETWRGHGAHRVL